jgi:hypothetical protein
MRRRIGAAGLLNLGESPRGNLAAVTPEEKPGVTDWVDPRAIGIPPNRLKV